MSTPETEAALRRSLQALLPAGTAAWVSHDPAGERPDRGLPAAVPGAVPGAASGGTGDPHGPDMLELDPLWPEELPATTGMRPARLREFRHGRHCARRALAALGLPPAAIPVGAGRAPVWPQGIAGSISHAGSWALAVAAPLARLRSLGTDLEAALPLDPPLQAMIATPAERHWLATRFPATEPGKLAFCAKESVYKCLWPVERRFIEFLDIELLPGPLSGSFRTAWRGPGQLPTPPLLQGRIAVTAGLILTAAWLPPLGKMGSDPVNPPVEQMGSDPI